MNKTILSLAATIILGPQFASGQVPPDTEIQKILADRVDKYRQSVGIVVGIIEPQGRRIVTYGRMDQGDPRPLNGDTIFEIASVTKIFTSLLLADAVQRSEVSLTDPLQKYLPADVKVPEHSGKQITLIDLATHTSGLPSMPPDFEAPSDQSDWESGYSIEKLYKFLSSYQLKRDPGSSFEYSNLGVSLLAIALTRRAGMDYETLLQTRIIGPLAMRNTGVSLTPEMKMNLATGHGYALNPLPSAKLGVFEGAGGLRSTANDLLNLLAANLGYEQTPLAPAMAAMLKVQRPLPPPVVRMLVQEQIHLGWISSKQKGAMLFWHNGALAGYRSFLGFDPKARVGVVVLSNAGGGAGMDDIGIHLLNPKVSLLSSKDLKPPKQHTEIAVDASLLDRYAGRYQFPEQKATVTRQEGYLILKGDDESPDKFYPETDRDFFSKSGDIHMTFQTDAKGQVTGFAFYLNGKKKQVKRID